MLSKIIIISSEEHRRDNYNNYRVLAMMDGPMSTSHDRHHCKLFGPWNYLYSWKVCTMPKCLTAIHRACLSVALRNVCQSILNKTGRWKYDWLVVSHNTWHTCNNAYSPIGRCRSWWRICVRRRRHLERSRSNQDHHERMARGDAWLNSVGLLELPNRDNAVAM